MFRSSDHPQGAILFLAKVILKTFTHNNSIISTGCCGSISCCVTVRCWGCVWLRYVLLQMRNKNYCPYCCTVHFIGSL